MPQKTMVHLHNGILCSRKKEGAPTLHNSMDGSGQHYAKWNQPGGERQIPYDLTYNWNLINKTNKQAKYNQRHWNQEQTDSKQRGGGRGKWGVGGRYYHYFFLPGTCVTFIVKNTILNHKINFRIKIIPNVSNITLFTRINTFIFYYLASTL